MTIHLEPLVQQYAVKPEQVAMLCTGDEVYGVGSVLKVYADALPTLTFVAQTEGPMVDWLRERGRKIEVVPGLARFHEGGASLGTILKMSVVFPQAYQTALRINARLRERDIRIVHAHWRSQQIIAGFLRRRGYQTVWHIHNNMTPGRLFGVGGKLNHGLGHWGADLLMPVSEFIARNWRGAGVPIQAVHNAAPPVFESANELPEGPVKCLIAGRLEHDKGHHLAVESVIRARKQGIDVQLDIFGGPVEGNAYAAGLQGRIRAAECEKVIRFQGFQSDLRSRHQGYHLGLQCRLSSEPCSVWICETHVDGLPLVASDSGGTPELVREGETGLLFPSGNVDAMTARLIELANNPQRMNAMRRAAFERGRQHFTVERFARNTGSVRGHGAIETPFRDPRRPLVGKLETNDRAVPDRFEVFFDDLKAVLFDEGPHAVGIVIGEAFRFSERFRSIGILNDDVCIALKQRFDVFQIPINDVQLKVYERAEREHEVHRLRRDTGKIVAVILDELDVGFGKVGFEQVEDFLVIVDGVDLCAASM